jgi:putative heme transporter
VVLGSFLVFYPATLMPLAGLGIFDAALLASFVEVVGVEAEPEIVAALVIWRAVTIGVTLLLGALALWWWRRDVAPEEPSLESS